MFHNSSFYTFKRLNETSYIFKQIRIKTRPRRDYESKVIVIRAHTAVGGASHRGAGVINTGRVFANLPYTTVA